MAAGNYDRIAKRYARALFAVCNPQEFSNTERQLRQLATAWANSADLRESMLNPGVNVLLRGEVVDAIVASIGGWVNQPTQRTVQALVGLRRAAVLPALAEAFARLVSEYRKSLALEVSVAKPITPDAVNAIRERLSSALGGEVSVSVKNDPSLIGGMTIRLGDTLLDRSVAGALKSLASQLV